MLIVTHIKTCLYAGADNYLCGFDEDLLQTARQHYSRVSELTSPTFQRFATEVMQNHALQGSTNWKDALSIYLKLREEFTQ